MPQQQACPVQVSELDTSDMDGWVLLACRAIVALVSSKHGCMLGIICLHMQIPTGMCLHDWARCPPMLQARAV